MQGNNTTSILALQKTQIISTRLLTRGVSHCGLTIYIKEYLKAKKEELWKLKFISPCKNITFKNNPLNKETKILQDIITL
jgi:hypothetical protein